MADDAARTVGTTVGAAILGAAVGGPAGALEGGVVAVALNWLYIGWRDSDG